MFTSPGCSIVLVMRKNRLGPLSRNEAMLSAAATRIFTTSAVPITSLLGAEPSVCSERYTRCFVLVDDSPTCGPHRQHCDGHVMLWFVSQS